MFLDQAHRAHLTALAALTTLRRLLPAPVVEIVAAEKGSATRPDRDGRGENGHPAKSDVSLPPCIQDRLAGLFGAPDAGGPARESRERSPVGSEN